MLPCARGLRMGLCRMARKRAPCQVHDHKPVQCRTWPFWEELLESPETYEAEVRNFCPGSRSGKRISADEIRRQMKETEEARQ